MCEPYLLLDLKKILTEKGYGIHETEISTLTDEHDVIRNDCPLFYVHNVL